ncbi:peptidoglycan DD-metalloendopeptidase family protein [Aliiroseovarius sp.]|uniref:peptidoglycan DD-metalloendopeptidase family protein n=1 Tax=Aliiroseovarius sp. TaxID=1872442 RepID=UPI003BA918FB
MSFEVDPRFKKGSEAAQKRRAKRQKLRIGLLAGGGLAGVALIAGIWWVGSQLLDGGEAPHDLAQTDPQGQDTRQPAPGGEDPVGSASDDSFTMVQVAASAEADLVAARAPFIDIAKDPMILHFESTGRETRKSLAGPPELPAERVGTLSPERLVLIRDDLVLRETQIVTRIPSSRADLAFFQASRSQGITAMAGGEPPPTSTAPQVEAEQGELISVDGSDGSWGELIAGAEGVAEDRATFVETQIRNTTSVAFMLREADRRPLYEDKITVLRTDRSLSDILDELALDPAEAAQVVANAERRLSVGPELNAGHVVAIRTSPGLTGPVLQQISLYRDDTYLGTLARVGAGRYDTGADPWIGTDLMARGQAARPANTGQEVRLLDAVYSAAIRNGLSTSQVGELIVMMSQAHDLDRFAAVGDRLTLLMAATPGPRGQGNGRILFAGIKGPSGTLDCYVVAQNGDSEFGCFRNRGSGGGGGGRLGGGLVVPVAGTKTSDFGPRMHPILRQLRNHNGVDWAAPTGTPVVAAAAGKIAVAGQGGGYGNVVYIDHAGGLQTRYAHLNAFADGISAGVDVQAGELIGYVGTTGRSTGPHLHFELHVNGTPVDPLTHTGPTPGDGGSGAIMAGGASDAVEALVDQIIRVESGGRADAANPNSTAVGLGQFIKGTWLRMMNTYRPDLVATMSEPDLLALRTNPDLSREMVRNLAREGEAYLRARGHEITPGRLYLAHFLGAGGADTALNADPSLSVEEVMGATVVNANGFLRDKTIGDLWAWADRKMGQRGSAPVARTRAVPAEVRAFIDLLKPILSEET